ncbi:MAG: hypothetical protein LQ352_004292 [Teloschistes flavicans]|nr:MAG: hypothetical protein LQ352_004292 [Teloschistes flavicans]
MTRAQAKLSKLDSTTGNIPSHCTAPAKNPKPRLKKQPFPFLKLPTELRVKIYHDALTYDRILIRKRTTRSRNAAAFLLTNRLIYSEAFPIFYDVNAFQVHIDGLPSNTETSIANVRYMRQCCLELELLPQPINPKKLANANQKIKDEDGKKKKKVNEVPKDTVIQKLLDKFLEEIWVGQIECLLIDAWEHKWEYGSTTMLEKFTWMSKVHLVQVVVNKMQPKGEWIQCQDYWSQRLEWEMMRTQYRYDTGPTEEYIATPRLGIDLVGEELEVAKRTGGWVIGENDLYVAFGKC